LGGDCDKMRILMMIIRWQGGHGTVARELKKELEKRGHEVHIASKESIHSIRKWIKINGEGFDIIYTFDWSMALRIYPLFNKKHYCLFHGHQPNKFRFLQTIVGKIMGKKLFVVGDTLKARFPKATLVYNGVDTETFKDLKIKRRYLGWIERDYELITKSEVIKLAEILELPLLTAKNIPYEKMNEFYNKCKIFISHPPDYTGFNMCWLEAIAAGVPKIYGNENGIGNKLRSLDIKDFTWEKNVDKLLMVWDK
jgi:glycosyltransferase involved in cell wall biosynthesis